VLPQGSASNDAGVDHGQIVIAGMYRQREPRRELVPSARLAEGTAEDSQKPPTAWRPVDRQRPDTWQPIAVKGVSRAARQAIPISVGALTIDGQCTRSSFPEARAAYGSHHCGLGQSARDFSRPGIAEVFIQGGDRKQYQILVNPAALLEYDVTLQQVEAALSESNLNTSGGFAVQGETERPIRILGRLGPDAARVVEDLRKIPIKENELRPVLLEDVARVAEGPQFKRGDGSVNGTPGVVFTLAKQPHVDTRELTDKIAAALADVEASLPADVIINSELFRLKNFIDRGIFNVGEAAGHRAVLVLIILFLFLLNFARRSLP
jgi:HME family heavy-metal exporter